jgi:hypothetical protein
MPRVENKILFVDVRKNSTGVYLKLSERRGDKRNSIIIPARGISELSTTLQEALTIAFPDQAPKKAEIPANKSEKPKREAAPAKSADVANTAAPKVRGGPAPGKVASPTKVYVNNLSWETSDSDLENHFGRVGEVRTASIRKSKSGRSQGQGTVEFASPSDALDAIEKLNNTELDGRTIAVRAYYEIA